MEELERLVRAETQLEQQMRINEQILSQLQGLDDRIRKLERYVWIAFGALAVLQFVAPRIVDTLIK